jgi:leucyl-tRNA---protein transferase
MTLPNEWPLQKLQFYVSTPYKCGYLPDKLAQSLIAAPHHLVDTNIYSGLIAQGFRRSGKFAYRPHCEGCKACIAIRLILDEFTPTRSQKRAHKQHVDLTARILPLGYIQSHFELYTNYQNLRHAEPELSAPTDTVKAPTNICNFCV